MTTEDKLNHVIKLLEILVGRKKRKNPPPVTDDSISEKIKLFTLANTGQFSAPEIAELCDLPKKLSTYIAISKEFDRLGIKKARTNKARFYVIT